MRSEIIKVEGLGKRYGQIQAIKDVSFEVYEGEIFGIVGPNGAGKTTTIEIIEGLRIQDEGYVRVSGLDPVKEKEQLKEIIGVQLQKTAIFDRITVKEALTFFGSLYKKSLNTDFILKLFSLEGRKNSLIKNLSGGEYQRLSVALAFVNDPKILFLDEPTTGMDPNARRSMWEIFETCRKEGKTIVLTTHYMEEAEKLCDRVAIIDHGKIIALDEPKGLIKLIDSPKRIEFKIKNEEYLEKIGKIDGIVRVERDGNELIIYTKEPSKVLSRIYSENMYIEELRVIDASLEDVFIKLTGRRFE
jgi:ABC-2 type transport system ATP-binding protein